jgi:hypothetical protein
MRSEVDILLVKVENQPGRTEKKLVRRRTDQGTETEKERQQNNESMSAVGTR